MSEIATRSPEQQLVAAVRGEQFREQVAMVLPPTVTPERFVRIATTAIMTNPDIAKLDHSTVLRAMVQAAADGLLPDGKHAAIVGRGGSAVYTPMISGFRSILAEFGWTLRTKAVYANDRFEWQDEPPARLHQPVRPGEERGSLIGAYAIATHKDGREQQMFMPWADIEKRRAIATTKAVWDKWPAEMAEKTVGKALFNDVPLAEADRERLIRVLEATEIDPDEATRMVYGGTVDARTAAHLPAAATDVKAIAHASPDGPEGVGDQQAPAAAVPPDEAAAGAPGSDQEEPSLADEAEPTLFEAPASAGLDQDAIVQAAQMASMFQIPNGDNKGLSLAEVHAKGDKGLRWLKYALTKIENPPAYKQAVWDFCRVYAPELYEAAGEAKEAAA